MRAGQAPRDFGGVHDATDEVNDPTPQSPAPHQTQLSMQAASGQQMPKNMSGMTDEEL